jgi:DNA-binding Lrp family transcriptional regulator
MPAVTRENAKLDRLDRQLLHALQFDGRVSFRLLGEVVGASEQTVARRYRRLREAGVTSVHVLAEPGPGLDWSVRIGVAAGGANRLAAALAARADVSWVSINSGGAEILCATRPSSHDQRDQLLLERLPQTNLVNSIVAHATLREFCGHGVAEWEAFADPLEPAQRATLAHGYPPPPLTTGTVPPPLSDDDRALLAALAADGRASYATLAHATQTTPARARRALESMLESGAAYLDTDLAAALLGFPVHATVWMTVAPGRLHDVGRRVGSMSATAHVAALSGPSNLTASVVCRDTAELYRFVTDGLGALPGIERTEVSPTMRRVKQASLVMEGRRLPRPF